MNSKIYVGNLSFNVGEDELRTAFEKFGTITDLHIANDRETGRPRGFAFITFETEEGCKLAIEKMNGTELDGRALTVNEARPKGEMGGTSSTGRTYSSPDRKAGAFHARGNRRH
jgi:RNA recognition motif-containing protein